MARTFRIFEGSLQQRFQRSRAKVQIFGGGFANGKTANSVIKALQLAKDYPGSNGLIARSTYPKLNDTIRKEFVKWCPPEWIKSFPMSQNSSNTATLTNGTQVNFRYVQQQGKSQADSGTSNLLSATYDWIVVDQFDDPEFRYKDFLDLVGRLRGSTPYIGDDPTMPRSGPRYLICTLNPTRNWFYRKIIKPLHAYQQRGVLLPEFAEMLSALNVESPEGFIELFEGATYENKDNLPEDYIKTLEALYTGQMRDRFLLGLWQAYEGLVYPQFDEEIHVVSHEKASSYHHEMKMYNYDVQYIEAFDHGIVVPSCYLFGYVDMDGNVVVLDGFYMPELSPEQIATLIKQTRAKYCGKDEIKSIPFADPSVFRRVSGQTKTVGTSTAELIRDHGRGVAMQRANNDIINGILKVQTHLNLSDFHMNPFTGEYGAPHLYISDKCQFFIEEISDFYWTTDKDGDREDKPQDKDDHAMDALRYLLTRRPFLSKMHMTPRPNNAFLHNWSEAPDSGSDPRRHRYGRSQYAA